MKLVSYNIQFGTGMDGVYDLKRIVAALEGADVMMLQEVERHWERTNFDDQVTQIADAFPDYYSAYGAHYDMDSSYRDDSGKLVQRRRQHGTMILSRVPLISVRTLPLPCTAVLAPKHSIQRGLQEALIEWSGKRIRLYNTHLNHMCPEMRKPQIAAAMNFIQNARTEGLAWSGGHPTDPGWVEGGEPQVPEDIIFCGDMNLPPSDPGYSDFTGPLSEHYGRISSHKHLLDSWVLSGNAEQDGVSCPPFGRIDYCFVSPSLQKMVNKTWIDTDCTASDHYPYRVEFDFTA